MGLGEHASKSRQHLSYTATGKHFRSEVTFSRNRLGAGDLGASEKSLHLAVFHLLVVQKSFQEYHGPRVMDQPCFTPFPPLHLQGELSSEPHPGQAGLAFSSPQRGEGLGLAWIPP